MRKVVKFKKYICELFLKLHLNLYPDVVSQLFSKDFKILLDSVLIKKYREMTMIIKLNETSEMYTNLILMIKE